MDSANFRALVEAVSKLLLGLAEAHDPRDYPLTWGKYFSQVS